MIEKLSARPASHPAGFWQNLKLPILGLAPMDGVTDAPFRAMFAKYGKPDLLITEFTSVEGLKYGSTKGLKAFIYDEIERPIVAQIFGTDPEAFYQAVFIAAELGFDGIDINMGCPATNVASKGAGAGLIRTPLLAQEIIRSCWKASQDWSEGRKIEQTGVHENVLATIQQIQKNHPTPKRRILPISVKTRTGYDSIVIEDWIKTLLEENPVNITVHGRTLKQLYSGEANWEAIQKAAAIVTQTNTTILGNGDIKSLENAHERIKETGVNGVLIGRAAFGHPYLFNTDLSNRKTQLELALEHARLYQTIFPEDRFIPMRKHLAWYCRGFPGASEVRQELMQTNTAEDVENILSKIIISP